MTQDNTPQPAPRDSDPRTTPTQPIHQGNPVPTPQAGSSPAQASGWAWGPAESAHDGATHQPSAGWGSPGAGSTADGQVPSSGSATQIAASGWGSPGWGAPSDPRNGSFGPNARRWTVKRGLVVGGVAVVLAGATAAGVYAATNSPSTPANGVAGAGGQPGGFNGTGPNGTGQNGTGTQGMPGGQGFQGMPGGAAPDGMGMGFSGLNAAIHSEYVVLQGQSYVTMSEQLGTVTAISSDSITVKSDDGFSRSYQLGSGVQVGQSFTRRGSSATSGTLTLADITQGSIIRITALKNGDTYSAQVIRISTNAGSGQNSTQGSSSN
ncbi:hypothetical protein [Arthrobacter sp. M4]|uniref:hypothetical protein n=1 Tax=Arthrobacter sp. M4 TaxID=218160 RepID=UPI001CDBB1D9|nr:hypothetical protein [Arthrobacter sp. M4]MCA4134437.1 hypothetical protein [Arthrobacter sp. M4]